jgi:hypothetical protein
MNCSNYNKILHLLAGLTLGYLMFGCKSSKPGCDAYSSSWDIDADSLMIYKNNKLYLPKIPANDAKHIYFNNIEKGEYTIALLKKGKIIETKTLNINK